MYQNLKGNYIKMTKCVLGMCVLGILVSNLSMVSIAQDNWVYGDRTAYPNQGYYNYNNTYNSNYQPSSGYNRSRDFVIPEIIQKHMRFEAPRVEKNLPTKGDSEPMC